jgi:CHAT domain-containing protein
VPYARDAALNRLASLYGLVNGPLTDLPGSKDEIDAPIKAMPALRATIITDKNATEEAFKSADLGDREIIHLAVHGFANVRHPDRAALLFLSDPKAQEDGLLQASEITHLRLSADLVVLSACDTAVGRLQGEEGIANLSRAFMLAGARAVVSTLWSVDDTFSLFLMKRFYAGLSTGETISLALRNAKLDVLHTFGERAVPYVCSILSRARPANGYLFRRRIGNMPPPQQDKSKVTATDFERSDSYPRESNEQT